MIRLYRNELTRFRSRRVIALLLLLVVLASAGVAVLTAWDSRPPSNEELATATARAEIDAGRSDIQADLNRCLADPTRYLGPGATQQECRDSLVAAAASYLPRAPLDLRGTLRGNGIGLVLLVASLLIIAASAFAGSDFGSGSMSNQVLFAPGRGRLWAAKALAVGTWSAVASVLALGGFWIALYLVADSRGVPHGSSIVREIGWHLLRAVLFCVAAAVGAFALTTLFRHAVATIGLLFAYSIGGEALLALSQSDGVARWTPGNNVFGWLESRFEYFGTVRCKLDDCPGSHRLTHADSGLYLLVLVVVVVAAGLLTFRRRDL